MKPCKSLVIPEGEGLYSLPPPGEGLGMRERSQITKGKQMMNRTLLLAIVGVGVTVFLSTIGIYWQQRRDGRSHEASVNDATAMGILMLGSAVIDYVAVVSNYS